MSEYWVENAVRMATERIARSQRAMETKVSRLVTRRPNTRDLVAAALTQPESYPPEGRAMLAKWAKDTYGAAAHLVIPYLWVNDVDTDDSGQGLV